MLSRRHLRIKVMQAIYAHLQNQDEFLQRGEKELLRSINKLYDLFIYQISFILEIFLFAEQKLEEAKQKYLPREEDIHPSTNFIDNSIFRALYNNKEYIRESNRLKISWIDQQEMIRTLYSNIKDSPEYKKYMSFENPTFKQDKKLVIDLFGEYIAPYENLESFYEENNIFWASDFPVINSYIVKCLVSLKENWGENDPIPEFRKEDSLFEEDLTFARDLFNITVQKNELYREMISERVINWEIERIAFLDMILLEMALAEILEFPTIPVKVSFNEYIEIAKEFSTPKSKVFINGILDKMIMEFRKKNLINKKGRGLVE